MGMGLYEHPLHAAYIGSLWGGYCCLLFEFGGHIADEVEINCADDVFNEMWHPGLG